MTWVVWLVLAVIVAAVAAVTGLQPKGARPVAGTHLMGVGRVVLLALVLIFAYLAFRARSGG
jgi:low temperature requirement protein LtrA